MNPIRSESRPVHNSSGYYHGFRKLLAWSNLQRVLRLEFTLVCVPRLTSYGGAHTEFYNLLDVDEAMMIVGGPTRLSALKKGPKL